MSELLKEKHRVLDNSGPDLMWYTFEATMLSHQGRVSVLLTLPLHTTRIITHD
jgi:hypothetical protein